MLIDDVPTVLRVLPNDSTEEWACGVAMQLLRIHADSSVPRNM
jgi:hypothetical protein